MRIFAVTVGRLLVLAGCLCLTLSACGTLTETDVTPDDLTALHNARDVDLKTEVDDLVGAIVDTGYTPGVVAGVFLPDGTMHFYSYGVADQETGTKPDENTLFAVGSLSKGFLAAMAAQLVDEGVVRWDDTLPKLLPAGVALSPDAQKITFLQLATHTSGLPRQPITLETLSYFIEYLFDGQSFYHHINQNYIFEYLGQFEANNPGTIQYSNIGYGLLAYILKSRTGKTIDQLLAERITGPLNLKCTGYTPETLPCYARHAHGYAGDSPRFIMRGHPTPDWEFTDFMRGAAALHSTAHDLLTFAASHLNTRTHFNRVLASNLQQRFRDPDEGIGVGWTIDEVEGQPIEYEIGLVAGYTSYLGVDSTHKTAVVILQNAFNWDSSVGPKLLVYLRDKYPKTADGLRETK